MRNAPRVKNIQGKGATRRAAPGKGIARGTAAQSGAARTGAERRRKIWERMRAHKGSLLGSELARQFGISRQSLVQDVAILRASGKEILSTPQGYRLPSAVPSARRAILACQHAPERTEEELHILVDNGVKVIDVLVEHPLYGELRGSLMLGSRADVADFMKRWRGTKTTLLSSLTRGVHLHTVEAARQEEIERAKAELHARGFFAAMKTAASAASIRGEQLQKALFHGEVLQLANPLYFRSVRNFLKELLASDLGTGDLTVQSLELQSDNASAVVVAKAPGVAAGLCEFAWLYGRGGMAVQARKKDGDTFVRGDTLIEMRGKRGDLLDYERVGLNLLQRMSGIATATRTLQSRAQRMNPGVQVVGTRKTPWGLLDKRALHLGGGGTHRLGLWDGIMVKNNHLALLADREEEAVEIAARKIWAFRDTAAFLEIEVRSLESAIAAARVLASLQNEVRGDDDTACPCLLLLDNMSPKEMSAVVDALRAEKLLEHVLLEASGNISEDNLEAYAACGVDAISVGALTHSVRALDLSQKTFSASAIENHEEL